jgi:hypothetical protein
MNKPKPKRDCYLHVMISPEEHKALKVIALNQDLTLSQLSREMVSRIIAEYKQKQTKGK